MGSDGLSALDIYNLPHRNNTKSYSIRIFVSLHIVPCVWIRWFTDVCGLSVVA